MKQGEVIQLPGTVPRPLSLKDSVKQMAADLPFMLEYQIIRAKMQRTAYKAYIAEGFDEKQALELIKGV